MSPTRHLRDAAAAHLAAGRLAEAAAAYEELLARTPGDFEAHHQLGTIRVQLGDSSEGHRLLAAAAAIAPGNAETWLHLGMAAQNLGRLEDAAGHYARALSLQPDYAATLFRLGVLLRHLGRRQDALATLDRCAMVAPAEDAVLQQRGELKISPPCWPSSRIPCRPWSMPASRASGRRVSRTRWRCWTARRRWRPAGPRRISTVA
jgi:tetratricopeptide (TPR) repeat protein